MEKDLSLQENLKEALIKKGIKPLENKKNKDLPKMLFIPFDNSDEWEESSLGLSLIIHHIETEHEKSAALLLTSIIQFNEKYDEADLVNFINYLNFQLTLPGLMLTEEGQIIYKYLIPVYKDKISDAILVLIAEAFNGLTSSLNILAQLSSGQKTLKQAKAAFAKVA
ncbi:MAG: hypothetical protein K0S07_1591 [Chlamydiales bacterium]|jgi:hypothetical protein|nr:hypothetical protein [Chlamydiales bacterium]